MSEASIQMKNRTQLRILLLKLAVIFFAFKNQET